MLCENPHAIAEVLNMFKTVNSDGDNITRVISHSFFCDMSQSDAQCIHGSLAFGRDF